MSGNICRCGAYSNIVEAVTEVAGRPSHEVPFTYEKPPTSPSEAAKRRRPHTRMPNSSPAAPICST